MANLPPTSTEQILTSLIRMERKLEEIERRIKRIEQDTARVKRAVKA
jgi:hypothetical protein